MEIAVISSYAFINDNNNYGALLQYYALQKCLKKRKNSVIWIRNVVPKNKFKFLLKKLYDLKSLKLFVCWLRSHNGFMNFVEKHLEVSKVYNSFEQLCMCPPIADLYIAGSDQVWGSDKMKENYLLFAPNGKPRISYAASFGKNQLPMKMEETIKPWLAKFSSISVREQSGVEICAKMGFVAKHLLDPTLLIAANEYPSREVPRFSNLYIYGYFLNVNKLGDIYWSQVENFAKDSGKELHIVAVQGAEKLFPHSLLCSPTPEEWLTDYRFADYIITNSFHGTVFALIHHRPFVTILQNGASKEQNERMLSLLKTFEMENRIWDGSTELAHILNENINWQYFETIKNNKVNDSYEFFKENYI